MQKTSKCIEKELHPRNLHNHGYDFSSLCDAQPSLNKYVKILQHGTDRRESIDFADPLAVKSLNSALLKHHYGIDGWDIPEGFLCPPIPGRVDYIHYVADLLGISPPKQQLSVNKGSSSVKMLDIGTGANGIYSLLAIQVYEWDCVACDIDPIALANVASIASQNPQIKKHLQLRHQENNAHIFTGIIIDGENYDISVCNPPFHSSLEEALKGSQKKQDNLARNRKNKSTDQSKKTIDLLPPKHDPPAQNFGGQKAELWCKGGEIRFLRKMLKESKSFASQCRWFTTLISKSENLKPCHKILRKLEATAIKEIEMKQGNKATRILAWSFVEIQILSS